MKNYKLFLYIAGIIFIISLFSATADDTSQTPVQTSTLYQQSKQEPLITALRYYDDDYKYNYRTGYSGDYGYNYDVEGYGDNGYVYGNIDTSGKYGDGYIYDDYGNELYVETEWTDYGVMEAYDENGNWYELKAH